MASTPQTDNSINALDLGVRLGRLEAGLDAVQKDLAEAKTERAEIRQDIKGLLKFMWGATAVIALVVAVVIPLAIAYGPWR